LKALFEESVRLAGVVGEICATEEGWEVRDTGGPRRAWATILAADRPAWAAPLYGCEMGVVVSERPAVPYLAVPTTPPVERDAALLVPAGVTAAQVEGVVLEVSGPLLAELRLFDEYRGEGVAGRSVAWRLVFRAPDRTLRDEEVDAALEKILSALKERLNVERRQA
jgi:hypothetical protein